MTREEWRDIEDYPNYEVSNIGRVRNKNTGRILSQNDNGCGYLHVSLWKDGKGCSKYVHRLVGEAFIPNPENKETINHKDLQPYNNFVDNLEWATYSENNAYGDRLKRQSESYLNNGTNCNKV